MSITFGSFRTEKICEKCRNIFWGDELVPGNICDDCIEKEDYIKGIKTKTKEFRNYLLEEMENLDIVYGIKATKEAIAVIDKIYKFDEKLEV